jgi:hypothetical protein
VIALPAPTLTSISPTSGTHGTTVPVTLTGTNLTGAETIVVAPAGNITVNSLTVVNSTTVTANFVIGPNAGPRNVQIRTPSGLSNTVVFTSN